MQERITQGGPGKGMGIQTLIFFSLPIGNLFWLLLVCYYRRVWSVS